MGLPPTVTKMGLVWDEGRIRIATQLLRGMSIQSLSCTIRSKADLTTLKGVKGLTSLNGKDAKEMLK